MLKKTQKITVREIARRTGYAHCTVARALSDAGNVAVETRSRILSAARELGYIGKNRTNIAVVVPAFGNDVCFYNTSIIHALSAQLDSEEFQYELIPENHLRSFNEKIIDGAISLCYTGKTARRWSELNPIPLVCINDFSYHSDRIYSVCSNDRMAMSAIVAHLRTAGHSRVLYIDRQPTAGNLNHTRRKECFRELAAQSGITPFHAGLSDRSDWGAYLRREKLTAIICPFEMTDLSLFADLRRQGLRIPQDVELIHWHIPHISDTLMPGQFTIRQDFPALARRAVALLKELLAGKYRIQDVLVDYIIGG